MSQVDIYTDIVLRTAAARGELKQFSSLVASETRKWAETDVTIDTSFRAPDPAAVMRIIQDLRQQVVEIPVRFVPQGTAPVAPASTGTVNQGNRFGTNTAANGGSSVAMSNGRPGVNAQGFAGGPVAAAAQQTINTTPLGDAIREVTGELNDLAFYLARMNTDSRSRSTREFIDRGGEGEPGEPRRAPSRAERRRQEREVERTDRRSPSDQQMRDEQASGLRARRTGRMLADIHNETQGWGMHNPTGNGGGYGGGGPGGGEGPPPNPPPGGGGGNGGVGRFGPAALLRAMQFGAGAYVADRTMRAVTEIGDSDVGLHGNKSNYARMNAITKTIDGVPVVGAAANLGTSLWNLASGRGFHSDAALNQRKLDLADAGVESAEQTQQSGFDVSKTKTRDRRTLTDISRREQLARLDNELADDKEGKFKVQEGDDASGRKVGSISAIGEAHKKAETARITADWNRFRQDDSLDNQRDDTLSATSVNSSRREAGVSAARASRSFGRQAQLDKSLGDVDDDLARKKAVADRTLSDPTADPREKARVNDQIVAESEAAKQKKLEETAEARRKWDNEDRESVAETEAANAEATGDYFDAVEKRAKASAESRIRNEDDVGRRMKMIRQADAEEAARLYKLVEQARHTDHATRVSTLNTNGRSLDASKQSADDAFYEQALQNHIVDKDGNINKNLNGQQQKLLDSLQRQRDASNAASRKQYRRGTEDTEAEAREGQSRMDGNRFGGSMESLRRQRQRELDDNKDKGPEGQRKREAIYEKYHVRESQLMRSHDDDMRHNKVQGDQSKLRAQGRGRAADELGWQQDVAEEIRDAKGDPALLKSVLAKRAGEAREKMMGNNEGHIYGSVSEYANSQWNSAANSGGGNYAQLAAAAQALSKADLPGAAAKLVQVSENFLRIRGLS